jgi:hypothetical protein
VRDYIALYLLAVALLAEAVYLHSPLTAVSVVVLWGAQLAQTVLTRKNRDEDIAEIMRVIAAHKAQMATLTKDITNVSERAQVILGEHF